MVELIISFNKGISFEVHRMYFKDELEMHHFLAKLDELSKERYTYIWSYVEVMENENKWVYRRVRWA